MGHTGLSFTWSEKLVEALPNSTHWFEFYKGWKSWLKHCLMGHTGLSVTWLETLFEALPDGTHWFEFYLIGTLVEVLSERSLSSCHSLAMPNSNKIGSLCNMCFPIAFKQ